MFSLLLSVFFINSILAGPPSWVKDKNRECSSSEICAVGSASSLELAKKRSRVELAKIFENNISSKFQSEVSSFQDNIREEAFENIQEFTDIVLEGVDIRKVHEEEGEFYVLAVLDKNKTSQKIKKEVENIDIQIKDLSKRGTAGSLNLLKEVWLRREVLNQRYYFLKESFLKTSFDYGKFLEKKNKVLKKYLLYIDVSDKSLKKERGELKDLIKEKLIKIGYRVSSLKTAKVTNLIKVSFLKKKLYLKVQGFVKYNFLINLKTLSARKEVGAISFSTDITARGFDQAKNMALRKFETYLDKHIYELNIE